MFDGLIKDEMQKALQAAMTTSIDTSVNKAIATIPIKQSIGFLELDYGLTNNPRFATSYFTTGKFFFFLFLHISFFFYFSFFSFFFFYFFFIFYFLFFVSYR